MMSYRPNVNCIYNDGCRCENISKRKRFLFWKYQPSCNDGSNCELIQSRYAIPSKTPMTIKISIDDMSDEQVKGLLDNEWARDLFLKLIRESANESKR